MRIVSTVAAVLMVLCASTGLALAGQPHERNGLFLGFNLGAGTADISADSGEDTDREWGGAGNFRIGGALNNNLLLGGEFTAWGKEEDGSTLALSTVLFAVTYYPGDQGLFLRGGVGFGTSSFEVEVEDGFKLSKDESGFAMAAAAGYEWRLTRKFALGPQVEFVYLNIGGDFIDTANYFDATLGFNWYW